MAAATISATVTTAHPQPLLIMTMIMIVTLIMTLKMVMQMA
jgi:hypothetical protein